MSGGRNRKNISREAQGGRRRRDGLLEIPLRLRASRASFVFLGTT